MLIDFLSLLLVHCDVVKAPYYAGGESENNDIIIINIQDLDSVSLHTNFASLDEVNRLSGFAKSNPPQAYLYLSHNSNNDLCEAFITEWLSF